MSRKKLKLEIYAALITGVFTVVAALASKSIIQIDNSSSIRAEASASSAASSASVAAASVSEKENFDCARIVGAWKWFNGGIAYMKDNHGINWQEEGNLQEDMGRWHCASNNIYVLNWAVGLVDTISLSIDNQTLAGHNQFNFPITAIRNPEEPATP